MTFPAITLVFMGLAVVAGWLVYRLLRVILWVLGRVFQGLGFLLKRSGGFVKKEIVDALHSVGALATGTAILPLALANLLIGRPRAAAYYGRAVEDELLTTLLGLYRVALGNPLRFVGAGILLDGFERRLPELVDRAPGGRTGGARTGRGGRRGPEEFDGYEIFGTLPEGGSGARLYLARPKKEKEERLGRAGVMLPREVVIKSFAVDNGSTLPQIVRESRALEAARRLGLVLDHHLGTDRFYYVMPYVRGEELNAVVHRMHANAGPEGLGDEELQRVLKHGSDLLYQLERFHRGGLWHKDIKPNNLIVAGDGRTYLVDFGLVTPLSSAMTLTTHGTEYYRDPEMVRLALRGVKVHEVDGVKFDLYSAGAVLFSMVENSFPAQGNLTRLTRRCPEALAWVIRRAMADMRARYGSAREMLEDLACLQANPNPWTVRPADLPSFRAALDPNGEPKAEAASFESSFVDPFEDESVPGFGPPPVFPETPVDTAVPRRSRRRRRARRLLAVAASLFVALSLLGALQDARHSRHVGGATAAAVSNRDPVTWDRFDREEQRYLRAAELISRELTESETRTSVGRRPSALSQLAEVLPTTAPRTVSTSGESARLLVLDDKSSALSEVVHDLADKLREQGHRVLDRITSAAGGANEIELFAGADYAVGLAGPDDPLAIEKLQSYLDRSSELDAVLWLARGQEPGRYPGLLLKRGDAGGERRLLLEPTP